MADNSLPTWSEVALKITDAATRPEASQEIKDLALMVARLVLSNDRDGATNPAPPTLDTGNDDDDDAEAKMDIEVEQHVDPLDYYVYADDGSPLQYNTKALIRNRMAALEAKGETALLCTVVGQVSGEVITRGQRKGEKRRALTLKAEFSKKS